MEMTKQLNDTAAATTQPLLVLQQSVSRRGANEELRERRGGHVATGVVPARRDRTVGCCHHWIIDVAICPLSKGICKQCGEEKLFRNQLRWTEIAPVKVVKGRRQENDDPETPDQRKAAAFMLAGSRYGSSTPLQSAGRRH